MLTRFTRIFILLMAGSLSLSPAKEGSKNKPLEAVDRPGVLWNDPADIASRDLFYGSGGESDAPPQGKFTFLKEDLDGTSPKFDVRDENGVKWKVKMGIEARPETAASRIVWAAGFFTNKDYFVPGMQVQDLPPRLHRGQELVGADGLVLNVRLKRIDKNEKKIGIWSWHDNPFYGTRQWNGLRVVMALINNWDLKDENNAVYQDGSRLIYMVSDLGASFGTAGRTWPSYRAKGDLQSYLTSRFIRHDRNDEVDFQTPARPRWVLFVNPKEYFGRVHLEWIGRDVPLEDARWMGQLLSHLSQKQIADAFRAAGYSSEEVASFSQILSGRIAALTDL
jgi:hypothetical protein